MTKKKKVGIREIAQQADVALSTVSHALNGTAPISIEVRNRVIRVASELGYLAKRQAKGTIAVLRSIVVITPPDVLPHADVNMVSWLMLAGLSKDCDLRGIQLKPLPISDETNIDKLVQETKSLEPDGVVIIEKENVDLISQLAALQIPTVIVNGNDPSMQIDSVLPSNRFSGRMGVNYLRELGHKKIKYLTWHGRQTISSRERGFLDEMNASNASESPISLLYAQSWEAEHGAEAIKNWIKENPNLEGATALYCSADRLAFGALDALKEAGIDVPKQISVLGFDGIAMGEFTSPPLTSIEVPWEEFGPEALNLLERRANAAGTNPAVRRCELGGRMIPRKSTAAVS